ncbi:MAG: acyltransferase [Solirubrobacterales bacterium]|nr:acyltransferase [Solirubrobacterales bacterium]
MSSVPPAVAGAQTPRGFRLDIQGIRGFALILVLAAHAEVPGFEGGFVALDLFFVLSGFLITGLILSEVEKTGRLSLRDFYARRARRLLPLAAAVLGVIAIVSAIMFATQRAQNVSDDVIAAALYFSNWHFIAQDLDYFAFKSATVSPVEHYWSLSVEEQFYLVWPLLVLGVTALTARLGLSHRRTLLAVLIVIGAASLAHSIQFSAENPRAAYLSTLTRVWQIVAGAILVIVLPAGLRLSKRVSTSLVAGGLAVLVATTVTYSSGGAYPGWKAIFPILATLAIIVGGTAVMSSAPTRLLSLPPFQYLGRISYSWYLWHWPALVFVAAEFGPLSWPQSVGVTLLAWVPSHITHHLIEERFRRSRSLAVRPRWALALGGGCTVTAVALALLILVVKPGLPLAPVEAVAGARAGVSAPIQTKATALRPAPQNANDDKGRLFDDGCLTMGKKRKSKSCVYGNPKSKTTVVMLGDSHALQYFPAMLRLAKKHDWRLVGLARASCLVGDVNYQPTCNAWRENTLRRIEKKEKPDLIVTTNSIDKRFRVIVGGTKLSRTASEPHLESGYSRTYRRLLRTGARLAVIRDQSPTPFDPAECVLKNQKKLDRCAFKPNRNAKLSFDYKAARNTSERIKIIDPLRVLCRGTGSKKRCPAVIGNALVYRDSEHLSATYARTLDDWLYKRLPKV